MTQFLHFQVLLVGFSVYVWETGIKYACFIPKRSSTKVYSFYSTEVCHCLRHRNILFVFTRVSLQTLKHSLGHSKILNIGIYFCFHLLPLTSLMSTRQRLMSFLPAQVRWSALKQLENVL